MGYDFPMNLPDTSSSSSLSAGSLVSDALLKRSGTGGGAITAGTSSSSSGSNGNGNGGNGHLDLGGIAAGGDPSSQLMAYKNPGGTTNTTATTTVTGDYIDLNELLNLEGGGHEEDNSILI